MTGLIKDAVDAWHPQRLLVIIVARIGDTLLVTPAIRALAETYPEAQITVLAHPHRLDLLRHLPFIQHLSSITKGRAFWRGRFSFLLGKTYDAAVVYGHDLPLVSYALRVAHRVVTQIQADDFHPEAAARMITVEDKPGAEHAVSARLRLVQVLGAQSTRKNLSCFVTAEEQVVAKRTLSALVPGGDSERRWVGLQLQSFPTKAYRDWPRESFEQLLEQLLTEAPDVLVVVLGDEASAPAAAELVRQFPHRVFSLAGRMSLRQVAAVMSRLSLYVGVDTGPTHLAGALGVPMVALYHCKHRGLYLAPLDHSALTVIEHPASDQECCAESSMAAISVEQVWQAVQNRLGLAAAKAMS